MEHKLSYYTEDFKKVEFCTVCGVENPIGECPGKYVSQKEAKPIDRETERK